MLNPSFGGSMVGQRVGSGSGSASTDIAISHFAQALRLSPFDPHTIAMQGGTAFAHLIAGRYDEAASWADKAMWEHAN